MSPDTAEAAWLDRPALRFTPPRGWMNDPNGLITLRDSSGRPEHHLFYQYEWPRQWGHAITSDFVRWEHCPVALKPDRTGDCWSGSIINDARNDRLIAIYTAWRASDNRQAQALAFSADHGRSWRAFGENPVLEPPPNVSDFRDPKVVWHEPTTSWVMVLASGRTLRLYRSDDLLDWSWSSIFDRPPPGPITSVWECPDLFELPIEGERGSAWVMTASYLDSAAIFSSKQRRDGASGTHALVCTFNGHSIGSSDPGGPLSLGPDDYATIVWPRTEQSPAVAIGWMNRWSYAESIPTQPAGWQGMLTMPRQLTLRRERDGLLHVRQRPVDSLKLYETGTQDPDAIERPARVRLQFDPRATACHAELLDADNPSGPPCLMIDLEPRDQAGCWNVCLIRPHRPGLPAHFERLIDVDVEIDPDQPLELEFILDAGGVELFVEGAYFSALCPVPRRSRLAVSGQQHAIRAIRLRSPASLEVDPGRV